MNPFVKLCLFIFCSHTRHGEGKGREYDLMTDLLDADMFKVYSNMMRSETLRIQQHKPTQFGYLPMMTVDTLGVLNAESES